MSLQSHVQTRHRANDKPGQNADSERDLDATPPESQPDERSISRPLESTGIQGAEAGFEPLATLPQDVPNSYRRRWERLACNAPTSYRAAVELKCLDCCCWERTEVKQCEIRGCALWSLRGRIFGVGSDGP